MLVSHASVMDVSDEHRKRLVAFYEQHNPEQIDTVDTALATFRSHPDFLCTIIRDLGAEKKSSLQFWRKPT